MFSDLNISNNTLHNMKTSMPKSDTLARIADYLGCSVDYLLGRTDEAKSSIATWDINNSKIDHSLNIGSGVPDSTAQQLVNTFNELSFEDKIKSLNYILD